MKKLSKIVAIIAAMTVVFCFTSASFAASGDICKSACIKEGRTASFNIKTKGSSPSITVTKSKGQVKVDGVGKYASKYQIYNMYLKDLNTKKTTVTYYWASQSKNTHKLTGLKKNTKYRLSIYAAGFGASGIPDVWKSTPRVTVDPHNAAFY